jgi:hypothetical protein
MSADLVDKLLYVAVGVLGAGALLWFQKLLSRLLPEPPNEIAELEAEVWRATITGDYYGDSDIDRLDRALTKAELEQPGSTARYVYDSFPAIMSRQIGSLAVSFIVAGWYLHVLPIGLGTIALLAVAVGALFYPFAAWMVSRPRRGWGRGG